VARARSSPLLRLAPGHDGYRPKQALLVARGGVQGGFAKDGYERGRVPGAGWCPVMMPSPGLPVCMYAKESERVG
jgi:hypothetical protein